MKKIIYLLGIIIMLLSFSIVLATEGAEEEAEPQGRKAWWYFEQQPIPLVQGLTLMEFTTIIVVIYLVYKKNKKK